MRRLLLCNGSSDISAGTALGIREICLESGGRQAEIFDSDSDCDPDSDTDPDGWYSWHLFPDLRQLWL